MLPANLKFFIHYPLLLVSHVLKINPLHMIALIFLDVEHGAMVINMEASLKTIVGYFLSNLCWVNEPLLADVVDLPL